MKKLKFIEFFTLPVLFFAVFYYSRVYVTQQFLRNGDWQDPRFLNEALEINFRANWWTDSIIYPDHYAGILFCRDLLVIRVTDLEEETLAFYRDILGEDAPLGFGIAEFSKNELISMADNFAEYLIQEHSMVVGSEHAMDTFDNLIFVRPHLNSLRKRELMHSIMISNPSVLPPNVRIEEYGAPFIRGYLGSCLDATFEIYYDI